MTLSLVPGRLEEQELSLQLFAGSGVPFLGPVGWFVPVYGQEKCRFYGGSSFEDAAEPGNSVPEKHGEVVPVILVETRLTCASWVSVATEHGGTAGVRVSHGGCAAGELQL